MTSERSVWALAVVVVDVDAQHADEVALAEDQQPVQALRACGSDEALGVVGIRAGAALEFRTSFGTSQDVVARSR